MTANVDLDRQLAWWFVDQATATAPEGLLERSLARVDATGQRSAWLVRDRGRSPRATGRPAMTRAGVGRLLAVAMAVVVVAAGAGLFLKLSPALVAGPSDSPSIAPVPSSSASPSPTPSETPPPTAAPVAGDLIAVIRNTDKVNKGPGWGCGVGPTCPVARLWLVGSDGRDAHELFPDGLGSQGSPAWSPDGTRLLYADDGKLYMTDASGSKPQLVDTGCVAPCAGDADVAFSSDGAHLVFGRTSLDAAGYIDSSAIATMDLASGQVSELSSTAPTGGGQPEWSPDGTQIVFSRSWGKGKSAVFVVDADGQNLHRISPQKPQAGSPGWSPDGSRIVFTSYDPPVARQKEWFGDYHQDIYTIRPDGTDLRQLTTDGISNQATWTPDGRILFSRGTGFVPDGGEPGFWTMDADGSNAARLMPSVLSGNEWPGSLPVWQPAGGPAIVPPPWNPAPATPAGPPPPTPAPTPPPPLASGFAWTDSMPVAEDAHAGDTATRLADGRVLVTRDCSKAAELYDPATGTFSPTGSLTATRGSKTATLLRDGRVLIAGGYDCGASEPVIWASAELYDPTTGTFTLTGSMGTPRSSHAATLLEDGRVLVVAGQTNRNTASSESVTLASYRTAATGVEDLLATAELYDPATGTFSPTGSMRDFRHRFTATLLKDGRVLVVGGGGEGYASRTSVELYDPATGTFSRTGSLKSGRWLHTATLLSDGRVLITGGRSPNDTTYRTAEIYDPGSGRFSSAGSMKTGRQQHTATLLPDGRVLIAGGYEQKDSGSRGQTLSSTELYDPSTGTFTPIGSMGDLRSSHSATLLQDGRVFIAGGSYMSDDGTGAVTSAVLYQP